MKMTRRNVGGIIALAAVLTHASTLTTVTTAFSINPPSPSATTMMTPAYLMTRTSINTMTRRNHFSSTLSLSPSSTLTSSSSSSSSTSAIITTTVFRLLSVLFPPSSSIGSSVVPFSYSLSLQLVLFATFRSKLLTMLTPSGYIHALALGTILWTTLGYKGWTVCVLYLLLGQLVTKIGFQQKTELGIAEGRGGRRGPENVWGSAAAGTICTLAAAAVSSSSSSSSSSLFLGMSREVWILGYVASLSTKLADTFASEIGKAYGQTTFLITSLKPVSRGTEGAISLEGTVASIVGGLLLSSYAYYIVGLLPSVKGVVVSTFAAFVATIIESVIGATLQGKKGMSWMTNEVVNFINTVIGAVVAMSLGVLLLGM